MTSKIKAPPALTHIVVLVVETEEPAWTKVFKGYSSARQWLAKWCLANWADELGKKPGSPHDICDTYFTRDDGDLDFCETADIVVYSLKTMKEIPFKKIPKAVMSA